MHGANAPLMKTMVAEQMELERKVLAGELSRSVITIEDAIPVSELETAGNKQNEEKQANDKNEWLQEMKKEASKKVIKQKIIQSNLLFMSLNLFKIFLKSF